MPTRPPSRADARRYAILAALAAETAVAVGTSIRADDVEIVTHKVGRANVGVATSADVQPRHIPFGRDPLLSARLASRLRGFVPA